MSEDELRTMLLTSSVPPPIVDVRRAVDDGYRQLRRRRIATSAGVMGLVAAVIAGTFAAAAQWPEHTGTPSVIAGLPSKVAPSKAPPAEACTVDRLPLPGADAMHVDPTGTYISLDQIVEIGGAYHPVLWSNGHQVTVPLPAGAANAQVNAINAHGVLVGMALTEGGHQSAFVYRDGKATHLPSLKGFGRSTAWGINAAGDIVGDAFNDSGGDAPVLWPANAPSTVRKLGSNGSALAIGDDGTIVGTRGDGDTPWVWNGPGAGHALRTPRDAPHGKAFAIRGDWVAGWVSAGGGPVPAARWNLRDGAVQVFTNMVGPATNVNARGDLVNGLEPGSTIRDGQPLRLPVGPDSGSQALAVWISDDGRTLIGSIAGSGPSKAAIWHCS
jgi:probable HAF family extracellular repeat protein